MGFKVRKNDKTQLKAKDAERPVTIGIALQVIQGIVAAIGCLPQGTPGRRRVTALALGVIAYRAKRRLTPKEQAGFEEDQALLNLAAKRFVDVSLRDPTEGLPLQSAAQARLLRKLAQRFEFQGCGK